MSARSVVAGATAVGLTMLAMICQQLDEAGHASVCAVHAPLGLQPAYPWAASLVPWVGPAGLVLLGVALVVAVSSQWRNTIPRGGLA
jgi:hypothetical protein